MFSEINNTYKILTHHVIKLRTHSEKVDYPLLIQNEAMIDTIWHQHQKIQKHLNGTFLHFCSMQQDPTELNIIGDFLEYKNLFAQKNNKNLNFGMTPIGVSGLIVFNEVGRLWTVFAKRSHDVLNYPGFFELMPSGTLDKECLNSDGSIDYKHKLIEEFEEETGLSKNCVISIKEIACILDLNETIYDIGCLIYITVTQTQFSHALLKSSEYSNAVFIPVDNLIEFVEKNHQTILPTSLALANILINKKDIWRTYI